MEIAMKKEKNKNDELSEQNLQEILSEIKFCLNLFQKHLMEI